MVDPNHSIDDRRDARDQQSREWSDQSLQTPLNNPTLAACYLAINTFQQLQSQVQLMRAISRSVNDHQQVVHDMLEQTIQQFTNLQNQERRLVREQVEQRQPQGQGQGQQGQYRYGSGGPGSRA